MTYEIVRMGTSKNIFKNHAMVCTYSNIKIGLHSLKERLSFWVNSRQKFDLYHRWDWIINSYFVDSRFIISPRTYSSIYFSFVIFFLFAMCRVVHYAHHTQFINKYGFILFLFPTNFLPNLPLKEFKCEMSN